MELGPGAGSTPETSRPPGYLHVYACLLVFARPPLLVLAGGFHYLARVGWSNADAIPFIPPSYLPGG